MILYLLRTLDYPSPRKFLSFFLYLFAGTIQFAGTLRGYRGHRVTRTVFLPQDVLILQGFKICVDSLFTLEFLGVPTNPEYTGYLSIHSPTTNPGCSFSQEVHFFIHRRFPNVKFSQEVKTY